MTQKTDQTIKEEHVRAAINQAKAQDPLVGVKIAARGLVQNLLNSMKDEKGVQVESLIILLSSIAGFACQMAIREGLVNSGKITAKEAFIVAKTKDGRKYFLSEMTNHRLVKDQHSFYGIVGYGAQMSGCTKMPDVIEIFEYISSTLGSDIIRMPAGFNAPRFSPFEYVSMLWPTYQKMLAKECDDPDQWPILFSFALQEILILAKGVIDPAIAFSVALETAVLMSKIDPQEVL